MDIGDISGAVDEAFSPSVENAALYGRFLYVRRKWFIVVILWALLALGKRPSATVRRAQRRLRGQAFATCCQLQYCHI